MTRLALPALLFLAGCGPTLVNCANGAKLRAAAVMTIATVDRVCPMGHSSSGDRVILE